MKYKEADFEPCDKNCPAVTGVSYGTVKYCPMLQPTRHEQHRQWLKILPYQKNMLVSGNHKDYTDCCANFQCCIDKYPENKLNIVQLST